MTTLRAACLLLTMIAALAASTVGVAAQEADGWARLLASGGGGSAAVNAIGLGSDWPNDGFLLIRRGENLVRSRDGGANWEDLGAAPAERLTVSSVGGARVALASGRYGIHRSTDDGSTWQQVLPLEGGPAPTPVLSPQFRENGRALVESDYRLYVSADGGAAWPQVEPVPGQRVTWAGFWPGSSPERDLYAIVSDAPSGLSGQLYRGGAGGWELIEPVKGRSVDRVLFGPGGQVMLLLTPSPSVDAPRALVSGDNGGSWSPVAAELAADGVPYRLSTSDLAPQLTDGGTMFIAAIAPQASQAALFRSDDLGASWTHLGAAPLVSTQYQRANRYLDVSPQFAEDRTALLVQNTSQGSPSSGACAIHRTVDGGQSWTEAYTERRVSCFLIPRIGPGGVHWFKATDTPGGQFWSRSLDGGQSWTSLSPGVGGVSTLAVSSGFEQDGILVVGTRSGEVWAHGSGLAATDGTVGCAHEPAGGFGRVWSTEPDVRQALGCPKGPEQAVQIRDRREGETRGLWIEDDQDTNWYELLAGGQRYQTRSKRLDLTFWMLEPDRVLDGAVQQFSGGTMLFLPEDGQRTILVLDRPGTVRSFPD